MHSKRCVVCEEVKPLVEYRKHSRTVDGYCLKCKECSGTPGVSGMLYLGNTKRCSKCRRYKPFSDYYRDKDKLSGIQSACKACKEAPRRKFRDSTDKFWKSFYKHTQRNGECLEWIGVYRGGVPRYGKRNVRRMVYELSNGELTADDMVMSSCDNRKCVRQSHLVKGTRLDVHIKRCNKAGPKFGVLNPRTKLTDDDVRTIRRLRSENNMRICDIAKIYSVSHETVSNIISGRRRQYVQ